MKKLITLLFFGFFATNFSASAQTNETEEPVVYRDYVGKYKFKQAPFEEIIVTISNGKLYGEAVGQGSAELKTTNEVDVLEVAGFDGKAKFIRSDGKFVDKLELSVQGQTLTGEKQQ